MRFSYAPYRSRYDRMRLIRCHYGNRDAIKGTHTSSRSYETSRGSGIADAHITILGAR